MEEIIISQVQYKVPIVKITVILCTSEYWTFEYWTFSISDFEWIGIQRVDCWIVNVSLQLRCQTNSTKKDSNVVNFDQWTQACACVGMVENDQKHTFFIIFKCVLLFSTMRTHAQVEIHNIFKRHLNTDHLMLTSFGPLEYQTSSVFRPPLYFHHFWKFNYNTKHIFIDFCFFLF